MLKTVPFPDLVVIEEESSELVRSKDLCVICMESESTRHKLLVTRCCHQFAHIFCHRRYYCIADVCLTQDYADEVTAKLYSENCFVWRSCPEQEATLDHFIVQHLIPEINPDTNDRRIQDANATLSSLCAGLTSKISPLLSSCKAGYLRCIYAVGQYSSEDGYVKKITPDLPTVCILQPREFQEEVLQCIKQFGENTITYFSLNKITEIVPSFHVTHSYMQFRPSRDENAGPFDLKWILKSLSKWKFALRCFNVNTFEVKLCEEEQLERIILTLTFVVGFFV